MKSAIVYTKKILVAALLFVLGVVLVCDVLIRCNADGLIYSNIEDVPQMETGLLLGSTPQSRIGGRRNLFFDYRIQAAEQLYKSGKISKILISGDSNSLDGVDETLCMRDSLVARGIPNEAIILDGKGYRTLNSVVRAKEVYNVNRVLIISQKFHNERALYQAMHFGIDFEEVRAFNATSPHTPMSMITYAREYLARVKVFVDMIRSKELKEEIIQQSYHLLEGSESSICQKPCETSKNLWGDTIVGNFAGNGSDTIWFSKKCDGGWVEDTLRFSFPVDNGLTMTYINRTSLCNEGDLDGDGLDEFGFIHTIGQSAWTAYHIYGIKNGMVCALADACYVNVNFVELDSVATQGPVKGTIRLLNTVMHCDEWENRDTIVDSRFIPIALEEVL